MQAKIARRIERAESKRQLSVDEQLVEALKSSRSVILSTLMQQWSKFAFSAEVPSFAFTFCEEGHLAQLALFETLCVKYFQHHNLSKVSASRFADELPAFGWALCYASWPTLLQYVMDLYCEGSRQAEYVRPDVVEAMLEDMFNIPNLDIDTRRVVGSIMQDLLDYCAAVQPAQADSVIMSPTVLSSAGDDSDEDFLPDKLADPAVVRVAAAPERPSDCTSSAAGSPTLAELLNNKQMFKSVTSLDEENEPGPCYTTTCSTSEFSEQALLHSGTVIRFFNMRKSKMWPLVSFQLQLRSIFFGTKYWKRMLSCSELPSAFHPNNTIFELTSALKAMYVPKQTRTPECADTSSAPPASSTHGKMREVIVKFIKRRQQGDQAPQDRSPRGALRALQVLLSFHNAL